MLLTFPLMLFLTPTPRMSFPLSVSLIGALSRRWRRRNVFLEKYAEPLLGFLEKCDEFLTPVITSKRGTRVGMQAAIIIRFISKL